MSVNNSFMMYTSSQWRLAQKLDGTCKAKKKFYQSEPAGGRVAQALGPRKIFVFIANMAKSSVYGGSEVYIQYLGLFDVMPYLKMQGLNGIQHHKKAESSTANDFLIVGLLYC